MCVLAQSVSASVQVPGGTLYPDAFDRCCTIATIASTAAGRQALLRANALPLLLEALQVEHEAHYERSRRQWVHAVDALHCFASTHDNASLRALVTDTAALDGLLAVAGGRGGLAMPTRLRAADTAILLGAHWSVARLLFCAVLKGDRGSCALAKCPVIIIRPILIWLMMLETEAALQPTSVIAEPLLNRSLLFEHG